MNKKLFILIFFLSLSITFNGKVSAQTASDPSIPAQISEIQEQIYVNVEPGNPAPNEPVKISIEAYGTDLTKANVTWKIDGVTAQSGRGIIELDTTAGDTGTSKKIDIAILPENGPEVDKSVTLAPEKVDLVWEAKTYVPPFYKGKALFSPQEKVVVEAFPNFNADGSIGMQPDKLTYNWLQDIDAVPEYSGYGKDFMIFQGTILSDSHTITVNITSDSSAESESFVALAPIQPNVLLYEDSPLYGVLFNKALPSSFYLLDNEKTLSAYPYYFGFKWRTDPDAQYTWSMNGADIAGTSQPSMIFKTSSSDSGQSTIGLDVKSATNFLVEAGQAINISFGSNNSSNPSSF